MQRITPFVIGLKELIIPSILVLVVPTAIVGFLFSGSKDVFLFVLAIFSVSLCSAGANVINNYADWKIDVANNKRRFLHSNFKQSQVLQFYFFSLACLFFLLIFFNSSVFLWMSIISFILLGVLYSLFLKLKDHAFLNYLAIGLAYGALSFIIGFFSGTFNLALFYSLLPIVLVLLLIDFGYSMTKDYEDMAGDALYNKKTLPVLFGKQNAVKIQFLVITLTYLFLASFVFLGFLQPVFLLLFLSYPIALYSLWEIFISSEKSVFEDMHSLANKNGLFVRLLLLSIYFLR